LYLLTYPLCNKLDVWFFIKCKWKEERIKWWTIFHVSHIYLSSYLFYLICCFLELLPFCLMQMYMGLYPQTPMHILVNIWLLLTTEVVFLGVWIQKYRKFLHVGLNISHPTNIVKVTMSINHKKNHACTMWDKIWEKHPLKMVVGCVHHGAMLYVM